VLIKCLAAIDPGVSSPGEFQLASGIESRTVAKNALEFLESWGVGKITPAGVSFTRSDKLKAALACIRIGCDIREVSAQLSWKDFEQLASEVLKASGYKTSTNVRFVRPRMEIDVVGIAPSFAIAVDCKHWNRTNRSMISNYSKKQAARASRLVQDSKEPPIRNAVPVVLTLQSESVKFIEGVPIVPIAEFRSFVSEVDAYLPHLSV
jgi:hypothetical protein